MKPKKELIVLTGIPGSGKTTLAKTRFPDYTRINLDTLKSRGKEDAAILFALENGENIIIDNTNTTKKGRKKYIEIAQAYGVSVKSIYLECPLNIALERNRSRPGKERVPDMAVIHFHRILEPPAKDEGFDLVHVIREHLDIRTRLDAK